MESKAAKTVLKGLRRLWRLVLRNSFMAVNVLWLLAPKSRPARRERQVTTRTPEFPAPGEASARKDDGQPVPGSRADRRRHGKA